MIFIKKINGAFYISFNGDNFHTFVDIMRDNNIYFDKSKKGYTGLNHKILKAIKEMKEIESFHVSDSIIDELKNASFGISETVFERKKFIPELVKEPPIGQFQIEDAKVMINQNRVLNANETGIGKTYETIIALNHLFYHKSIDKVLILSVPESVYNWKIELLKFGFFEENDIMVITKDERNVKDYFDKKVLIMSYRTFQLCSDYYYKLKMKKTSSKYRTKVIDFSLFGNNRCLVLDESHLAKTTTSRTFHLIKLYKDFFEYRYCLTATPYPNIFTEIYANLFILDKSLCGSSQEEFLLRFGELGTEYSSRKLDPDNIDEKKVEEFIDSIKFQYIRRFKKDVLPDMPDQIIKKIYIEMSKEHEYVYGDIIKQSLQKEIDEYQYLSTKRVYNTFPYLTLACSDPSCVKSIELESIHKWNSKHNKKFEMVDLLLEKHEGEKILLWSIHPTTIKLLEERYKKYDPYVIDGTTNTQGISKDKYKEEIKNDFRLHKTRNLAIFSPLCMGTSISIPESTVAICFDRNYSSVTWTQLLGRNYRITSKKDVIVYVLIYDNSLEVIQDKMLENKFNLNKILLSKDSVSDDVWSSIFKAKAHKSYE
jgi:superfamily II DNA or RNA helicase